MLVANGNIRLDISGAQEQKISQLESELAVWEEFAEWVEHMSGLGQTNLSRSDFDDAVSQGEWTLDDNEDR